MKQIIERIINFFLLFLVYFSFIGCREINEGNEAMQSIWEPFSAWYEWKKATELISEQRVVIDYFDKVNFIVDKVEKQNLNSIPPERSIEIIKKSITNLENIVPPKVCTPYYEALSKELAMKLEYQEARKIKANDKELQEITLKILSVEGTKFTSFFQALKDIGFFDNYEKEIKMLRRGIRGQEIGGGVK